MLREREELREKGERGRIKNITCTSDFLHLLLNNGVTLYPVTKNIPLKTEPPDSQIKRAVPLELQLYPKP